MLKTAFLLLALAAPSHAVPAFQEEANVVRLSSAVLQSTATIGGAPHYFYIRGSTLVYSATTADDGLSFIEDAGIRLSTSTSPQLAISSITGLAIIPLAAGGYRMLYAAVSTGPTNNLYSIVSATSSDGLAWANDTGTRLGNANGSTGFIGSPSLLKMSSGKWRIYYTANTDNTAAAANRGIYTGQSSDEGLTFPTTAQALAPRAGDVAAMKRTDGKIRLLYTAPTASTSTVNSAVYSLISAYGDVDGSLFSAEAGIRLSTISTGGFLSSPFVLRSTESWRWRMYYNYTPFTTPQLSTASVFSASTFAADPTSITPSTVLRTGGVTTFTIKGEIFSPAPTLQLRQGNSVMNQTAAPTVADDQNISVNFNVFDQPLGLWDLAVTNDNGIAGTLSRAVNMDFAAGSVTLTDNLLRPRSGTRTTIVANTFNDGRLTVRLYTLRGDLVATLFDSTQGAGTTTLFWDGKTALGNTVASGVYLLRVIGQKIDTKEKIVVIK